MEFPDIIILAGGLGTRLRETVQDIPKAMAPVNGRPFLEYQLDFISHFGFKRVILSTGYLSSSIENHFGNSYRNLELVYSFETEPLGTGGAVKLSFEKVKTPHALILNGDTLFRINLDKFFQKHIEDLSKVSIALRHLPDASRYGMVECNHQGSVVAFKEKSDESMPGLINGGIYLIRTKYFRSLALPDKFSLEKELFSKMLDPEIYKAQIFNEYFLDIGIPDDYYRAQTEFHEFKDR
ncbi:MAG: D-glycero-alpha-D-manno-heptose 1-phosphate guanylyltransferase [Bacteroidetes bacterium]|nr:MAG: D-glycero-alpha-D-manno-heptose 1-phosphate guanylyltransferase [Bacteroidota bacterium]